ncbi:DNA alkylation repair protein [Corallococcus sp. CA049B]|uniref:DNA alkylation repair protein n=1 Tax=Corallococcus sp. CA049B TaxID=2316730 RepID=UPI000EA04FD6|nr:DNA alkylation repair protein [Corallococcus sp. CA049B]RKG87843.1 DNA alkylation repair protein [Corallococcus sp. CA049B]
MPKTMTLSQVMKLLESQGDERVRQRYVRDGVVDNVFGVLLGKLRSLAATLGTNHGLGLELWETGNHDARILACMLLEPAALTEKEARGLLEPLSNPPLVDELVGRVLVHTPVAPKLQARWMDGSKELPRRAGWKLLAGRIARGLEKELDAGATLKRIERELPEAPYRVKEGINFCLVWMGLHLPAYTSEAIAVGERLGRWDPRPIPKGCTSSYAPEWIAAALALRKGEKTDARKAMEAAAESKATRGEGKPTAAKKGKAASARKKSAAKKPSVGTRAR